MAFVYVIYLVEYTRSNAQKTQSSNIILSNGTALTLVEYWISISLLE